MKLSDYLEDVLKSMRALAREMQRHSGNSFPGTMEAGAREVVELLPYSSELTDALEALELYLETMDDL